MKITVRLENPRAGVSVFFADFGPGYSTAIVAEGLPYQSLQELVSSLSNTIHKTISWYSVLSNNRGWSAFYFLFMLGLIVSTIVWWASGPEFGTVTQLDSLSQPVSSRPATIVDVYDHAKDHPEAVWKEVFVPVYGIVFILVVVLVRPLLYPKGQFLIGRGIKRAETLAYLRHVLLTAIILPLVLRLILD